MNSFFPDKFEKVWQIVWLNPSAVFYLRADPKLL